MTLITNPDKRLHSRSILGLPVSVFAGGAYCAASMSMVGADDRDDGLSLP